MKILNRFLMGIVLLAGTARMGYSTDPAFKINADKPEQMFLQAPFLSPKIFQDLSTWISDTGDQVTSINLLDSQDSNRYFGDIKANTNSDDNPYVFIRADKKADGDMNLQEFGYRYIGKTKSGIYVLETSDYSGGSGVFETLIFVTFEKDHGIAVDFKKKTIGQGKPRFLMKKVGEMILGDRCQPDEEKVQGNDLILGKDIGVLAGQYPDFNAPQTLTINYDPATSTIHEK